MILRLELLVGWMILGLGLHSAVGDTLSSVDWMAAEYVVTICRPICLFVTATPGS